VLPGSSVHSILLKSSGKKPNSGETLIAVPLSVLIKSGGKIADFFL
jgi:hypothetical protein